MNFKRNICILPMHRPRILIYPQTAISEVEADITTVVDSIKNPKSGVIRVPGAGEIIMDDPQAKGRIIIS